MSQDSGHKTTDPISEWPSVWTAASVLSALHPAHREAFRRRAYTLANCGVFYARGMMDACGRDTLFGGEVRALIEAQHAA